MKTPADAPHRSWLAALAAVVLLALMAAPADAQRGYGGRGHGHHGSGHGAHVSGSFGPGGHFGFFGGRFGGHFGFGNRFGGHFGFGRQSDFGHFGFDRHAGLQPHFSGRHMPGRSHRGHGPHAYFGPYAWYSPYTWYRPAAQPQPRVYDWAVGANPGAGAPQGPYIEFGGYRVRNLAWEAAMAENAAETEAETSDAGADGEETRPTEADLQPEPTGRQR